jgi:hypothetical protein
MRTKLCLALLLSASLTVVGQSGAIKYSVPDLPWSEYFGNHRAVIKVDKSSDAVLIDFLWRRHDALPDKRGMFIINAKSGKEIKNIFRVNIDNERCNLVFGPVDTAGLYYFYYLPSTSPSTAGANKGRGARNYMPVEKAPDSLWVLHHQLTGGTLKYQNVVKATITEIQARTAFDSFYPMEVIATKNETNSFLNQHKDNYLVFPEDRTLPIRMLDAIPFCWTQKLPGGDFSGKAKKNEYYALQLGVFASQMPVQNIKLEFSDLTDKNGNSISRKAFTCYNTDGVDINGNPFTIKVDVKQGMIQPLWVGIDIPPDAKPGIYESVIGVKPENLKEQKIKILLTIENDYLADRGDGETWRHSRLRWLNSTLGIDNEPVAPYTSLVVNNQKISCLGRSVQLNNYGFPEEIDSWGNNILATSVKFTIQVNNQAVTFPAGTFSYKLQKNGIVAWESIADNKDFTLICKGEMEFDGRLNYNCEVKSKSNLHIQDIRLELPIKKEFATYMIGMSRSGGYTPKNLISMWSQTEDSFWIGETNGGIQCQLRGSNYHVPRSYGEPFLTLFQLDPPSTWFNDRNGGFRIDSDDSIVTASAFSGMRNMVKGQSVNYEFALLITPVKKLDYKSQFTNRYFHATEPTPEVLANGGNVMNVHHANQYNPYINYPFIAQKEMRGLVDKWHAKGWKVKIYYTVREISNRIPELWALRSLGTEVLADGNSGGDRWLQEHLVNNYGPAWYAYLGDGESDQAIMMSFISDKSRWYNYYVEGLNWLVKNMDIDGLYLDDVTFDRRILKRMRKVMEMVKPGCMIDLHSHTGFSRGAVNHYLEFFPYIDKTWFGEGFNFDIQPADFWLTETSGIPFGIMNDLLMGRWSVNTHRGMTFGMTVRGFTPMWKLWDDFGIKDSKMIGYWERNPIVTIDHKNVFATTYVKDGKTLIAIGSWVGEPVNVKMDIDWKRLGLNPLEVSIIAPEIKDYQKERLFKVDEPIPIDPNSDCLLIISKK